MDEDKKNSVHCPECSMYVTLPNGQGAGAKAKCPFCFEEFMVEEMTVLVPRPLNTEQS